MGKQRHISDSLVLFKQQLSYVDIIKANVITGYSVQVYI